MKISKRLDHYFKDYAPYHRTQGNRICHYIGIPMIAVALLGLLSGIQLGPLSMLNWRAAILDPDYFRLDGGSLFALCAAFWYLYLDWKVGIPFSFVALGLYFMGRAVPVQGLWVLFVLGWIFQFVGHGYYEKKSPAFMKNVAHFLIGPLWIFSKITGYQ